MTYLVPSKRRNLLSVLDDFLGEHIPDRFIDNDVVYTPSVNVKETDAAYIIEASLPGFEKEDIHVDYENGVLSINATHKSQESSKDGTYHYQEIRTGSFRRSFRLGDHVQVDDANAEYKNGILTLTVPKSESSQSRKIKVS